MNARTRFPARSRRLALPTCLLLLGLLVIQGLPATAARASITGSGNGASLSVEQSSNIRVIAAAAESNRASASQPNLFDLHDPANHTRITYSTSGMDGRPHLNYTDPRLQGSFSGKEIRVMPSEIGTQVSVTLEQVPDLHTITLTLLVPAINMRKAQATFSTYAVLTTQHTSIGGPAMVKGALQTYQVLTLQGTAHAVLF